MKPIILIILAILVAWGLQVPAAVAFQSPVPEPPAPNPTEEPSIGPPMPTPSHPDADKLPPDPAPDPVPDPPQSPTPDKLPTQSHESDDDSEDEDPAIVVGNMNQKEIKTWVSWQGFYMRPWW